VKRLRVGLGGVVLGSIVVATVLVVPTGVAGAQSAGGLSDARRRAEAASDRVHDLEAELGEIDGELARLDAERQAAEAELTRLRDQVQRVAVDRYARAGSDDPILVARDLNEGERARALAEIVTQNDRDAVDRYAAARNRLERATEEVEERRSDQAERLDALEREQQRLADELDRLEAAEAARVENERRAAEEEAARRADDAAARARADQLRALEAARAEGKAGGVGPPASAPASAPPGAQPPVTSPPRQVVSGSWVCPVQGARTFRDSWGDARSGGRSHKGTDIMSPRGTPVVNPVSGTVTTKGDRLGGLSMHVQGDDGNYYFGTHLDSYSGATGYLPAGTVVGYVGDTGNAVGTHLHFEIHVGGYGNPINPYPTVARYC
jgi:murein DD-endopeptidase MepM/ murein hydrolase activator NlpD